MEPEEQEETVFEPDLLSSFNHDGDVNDIHFLTPEVFAVGSSEGTVTLVKIDRDNLLGSRNTKSTGFKLTAIAKWNRLHFKKNVPGSCNAISCAGDNVLSAGSNGQMFVLNGKRQVPLKSFNEADSGSISSVLFLKQDQAASGNTRGQVKIWDLRANENSTASKTCHLAMDLVGVTCLAKHPTQPHGIFNKFVSLCFSKVIGIFHCSFGGRSSEWCIGILGPAWVTDLSAQCGQGSF